MVIGRILGKTVVVLPRGDVPLTLRLSWEEQYPDYLASLLGGLVNQFERVGYRVSDAIITYTPSMAESLGVDEFEEKLYPHGARYIDTERFQPTLPYVKRNQVVGFVGRLDQEKNIEFLANTAKHLPEWISFRFVGDGDRRDWLETELKTERKQGNVTITGWVDHDRIPHELNQLRLLLLPSQPTEGLPTVILESLSCGTPVCATPVSGIPDVVRDGTTGFLHPADEPEEFADTIVQILKRGDLEDISTQARRLIEQEYCFDAAVERYRSILTDVSCHDG